MKLHHGEYLNNYEAIWDRRKMQSCLAVHNQLPHKPWLSTLLKTMGLLKYLPTYIARHLGEHWLPSFHGILLLFYKQCIVRQPL